MSKRKDEAIARLQHALLETGQMNQLFVDQITSGEVDNDHVDAALYNLKNDIWEGCQRYVLGFMFNMDRTKVMLVWKNPKRFQGPDHKLNGIGCKLEGYLNPYQVMIDDFRKETGFIGIKDNFGHEILPHWQEVGIVKGNFGEYKIHVFASIFHSDIVLRDTAQERLGELEALGISWTGVYDTNYNQNVLNVPLNFGILKKKGRVGLDSFVKLTLDALENRYTFEIKK